ncbi:unnamed protein product [Brachionus calyciflorus]|uniref:Uncharacterized protein n=1 Tax=Brachionus calyciflorus TaxID=104777 RepID=A0A814LBQ1_9BILA|nr:unnamed protein product [Brachionus calyciflorus]
MKYFFPSLIIVAISLHFSLGEFLNGFTEEEEDGTCQKPFSLFKFREPLSNDLLNFTVTANLTLAKSYIHGCYGDSLFDKPYLGKVFQFEIKIPMYIQYKITDKSDFLIYVLITDSKCDKRYECLTIRDDDDDNNEVNYLGPGIYNIILITSFRENPLYDDEALSETIGLNLSFLQEPNLDGSFKNPKPILVFKLNDNFTTDLAKNSYHTKLNCSLERSPSVVYSFSIQNETEMIVDIKLYSLNRLNKLDTVLGLTDANGVQIENWCNDDSSSIGGLSSHLNGVLTSGDYRLIASGYDSQTFGQIELEISRKINKMGSIGPIVLNETKREKFNGTFIENYFLIEFQCSSYVVFRYVVIPLTVSNGLKMNGHIKAYGANKKNKLDTILELRDDDLNIIPNENFCNDDSPHVGGLSSFLNVSLSSGNYKLVLGHIGYKRPEAFTIEFDLRNDQFF